MLWVGGDIRIAVASVQNMIGNRGIVRGRCGGLAVKLQSFVFIAQFFVGLSDEALNEEIVLQLLARLGVELN